MATKIDSQQIIFDEQNPAPGTPATGKVVLYAKSDGNLYQKDDAGVETLLGGGGGMTSFTMAGDSGTPQTITDGDTLTIAGGTGLSSVASATDTVTVNLDVPVTAANGGTGQTSYSAGDLLYATGATTLSKLPIGTTGQVLTVLSGAPAWATGGAGGSSFAELRYQVEQNTAGQSISAITWTTVTLNTETSDPDNIVTIANNQFTPISGTYLIRVHISIGRLGSNITVTARIQNITASITVTHGVNSTLTSGSWTNYSMTGVLVADGTTNYAIQVFSNITSVIGNPINSSSVGNEVYMQIILQKVG